MATAERGRPWPVLTAAMIIDYSRNGTRVTYEYPYFSRRNRLGLFVLAECLEYRGRYLDDIAEGLWQILSEPDWCLPAHASYQAGDPLPLPGTGRVDLFCAATGMLMAETIQLLGPELEAFSASLVARVRGEGVRRVIEPVEGYPEEHWWLDGFNNWTPWCASNVAGTALAFVSDADRLGALLLKLMRAAERFVSRYPADGGCNEGPMYWFAAPVKLLLFMDLINNATGGAYENAFKNPLFRAMGEYIVKVNISGPWFLSVADSTARIERINPGLVYRYGEVVGNDELRRLALAGVWGFDPAAVRPVSLVAARYCGDLLTLLLRDLFWMPADIAHPEPRLPLSARLPDLQVFIGRECCEAGRGFVMSLKGGHNDESHNHNDLGQFEVFCDGRPVVVDVGVETYTRQTFSSKRYELWCIGAQGHNVPEINGYRQEYGAQYHATVAAEEWTGDHANVVLDLSAAYPEGAGVATYRRSARLDRKAHSITVSDHLCVKAGPLSVVLPLYCAVRPEKVAVDSLRFTLPGRVVDLRLGGGLMCGEPETLVIEDERLAQSWGGCLYRILLTASYASEEGSWSLVFTA